MHRNQESEIYIRDRVGRRRESSPQQTPPVHFSESYKNIGYGQASRRESSCCPQSPFTHEWLDSAGKTERVTGICLTELRLYWQLRTYRDGQPLRSTLVCGGPCQAGRSTCSKMRIARTVGRTGVNGGWTPHPNSGGTASSRIYSCTGPFHTTEHRGNE